MTIFEWAVIILLFLIVISIERLHKIIWYLFKEKPDEEKDIDDDSI